MKLPFILALAVTTSLSSAALAQGNGTSSGSTAQTNQAGNSQTGSKDQLSSVNQITQDLQKSGFTDVQVVAEAFVVQAKTKDGHPVVMTMGPHGFSAFEAVGSGSSGNSGKTSSSGQTSK